ncbi:MAG: tRNA 4-thiouridine(8) synthase ThiI [Methanoregulaceae archaeon]|nr:tRNA 4-thiouridine(8) synthase ThiI [Methanoregulaceae archaeon]
MNVVMVRYGELFLKSEPVKRHFIGLLTRNITKALDSEGIVHRYRIPRGRLLIFGDEPERIAGVVSRIFGVVDVSIGIMTSSSPEDLARAAVENAAPRVRPGMHFAVRARRQGVDGFSSQDLGAMIGGVIQENYPDMRVDLKNPEYEIFVEARDFGGLVYDQRVPAPGGLPWGTQGRALALLSAGIDSPVASWLMMKRGCEVLHLHMEAGRWAGCGVSDAAVENHRRLSEWCRGFPLELLLVRSEPLYDAMEGSIPPRLRCVICKRFMLMTACRLLAQQDALVVVTGENLGQVASQTLSNLTVISDAATAPVIRPLITYDKDEIVTLARRIGTFNARPGDLCCRAVPRMPATSALPAEIATAENAIGVGSLVHEAVKEIRSVSAMNGVITGSTGL